MTSLFIFRRDFRIQDNLCLDLCSQESTHVIPVFIFTPEQIENNKYRSDSSLQFMLESLNELDQELKRKNSKLHYFYGSNNEIIKYLIKKYNIENVYCNRDYTPYAKKRDSMINKIVNLVQCDDYTLIPLDEIKTLQNTNYKMFTPFYNNVIKKINSVKVSNYKVNNFHKIETSPKSISLSEIYKLIETKELPQQGGRKHALKILKNIKKFSNYNSCRDFPSYQTTLLSAHIKFGNVSVREILTYFLKLSTKNDLIKQLIWHDFYANIMDYTPYQQTIGGSNFKQLSIKWGNSKTYFNKWKNGKTGFPFIDASMIQLNTEGYISNRSRLCVASFLCMYLHIDWKKGEKYFAQKLYDYDVSSNNGNWQWVAQVGVDNPRVWPRVFDPIQQSKKFDINCIYIKTWIPELKDVENKKIHNLNLEGEYIPQIIDHKLELKLTKTKYYKK
jgi:deoxyribodipyrimidine photo-lyase